ncbi:MAG: DUF1492 domain-containing protein [Lachnospiraceae bacterium]|nr:DUF1492 domain-containing protein [Lachnospiraceae bacterium]
MKDKREENKLEGHEQPTEIELKKEYLREYEKAVRQMERSELKMQEIRLNKICPSVIIDGMPHASNHKDLSGYAALIDQEEKRYMEYRYQRIKKCKEITDRIELLEDEDEKDILMYRYIKLMKWEDICMKIGLSWKQAHRIHTRALANF